jgi:hypothetical protein
VAEISLAGRVVGSGSKDLAGKTRLGSRNNVLEDVALSDDLGAGIGLEGVLGVGVEVVVDGVEEGVTADLGGAAGSVMDVVALHGNEVVRTGKVDSPVVVSAGTKSAYVLYSICVAILPIASCGPSGGSVDLAVGNGDAVGGAVTEDNVLTGNEISSNVV